MANDLILRRQDLAVTAQACSSDVIAPKRGGSRRDPVREREQEKRVIPVTLPPLVFLSTWTPKAAPEGRPGREGASAARVMRPHTERFGHVPHLALPPMHVSARTGVQLRRVRSSAGAVPPRASSQIRIQFSDKLEQTRAELGLTAAHVLVLGLMLKRPWLIPNKALAEAMNISTATVSDHMRALIDKFGVTNKWDMLQKATKLGFMKMDLCDVAARDVRVVSA